jgi:hypothetical protein
MGDHCTDGMMPEASDATMASGFGKSTKGGQTDATVQPEVIAWMKKHAWQEAHYTWHEARRCSGNAVHGGAVNPCKFPEFKPEQNECSGTQDGYEFLVMHRHMIQSLKQLWPKHTEQFNGWTKFPAKGDYPDILQQYFTAWPANIVTNAASADGIDTMTKDQVLAKWPTEGAFGQWIQCTASGLHGALHFNALTSANQDHSIANQRTNIDAYLFWKLHG